MREGAAAAGEPEARGAGRGTPPGHIHLDAVGGVAGDMFAAALLDACPELQPRVWADLAAVAPPGRGTPVLTPGLSGGLRVQRFGLADLPARAGAPGRGHPASPVPDRDGDGGHAHDHGPALAHSHAQSHDHTHDHTHDRAHGHTHDRTHGRDADSSPVDEPRPDDDRNGHPDAAHPGSRYVDLARHIDQAALHPGTAEHALAILKRLALTESHQHGVPLEAVHFHELADWDSLLDVVAAGSIAAALSGWTWSVSALPRGGGVVRSAHGLLPVPAPATVELLRGFAWRDDGIGGERVTPTGAAILAHLVDRAAPPSQGLHLGASGTGAGTRELAGAPNVLRALVFVADGAARAAGPASGLQDAGDAVDASAPGHADAVVVLSFDVDDMSGEELGVAADRLRALPGVLDLSLGTRIGKKGRPLHDLRLLLRPDALDAVRRRCFAETSTIGLRWRREDRWCLERRADHVDVDGRALRRKHSLHDDGQRRSKVESDDLAGTPGLAERRRLKALGEGAP